jgi:hypothetical protein
VKARTGRVLERGDIQCKGSTTRDRRGKSRDPANFSIRGEAAQKLTSKHRKDQSPSEFGIWRDKRFIVVEIATPDFPNQREPLIRAGTRGALS